MVSVARGQGIQTGRLVVADCEDWCDIAADTLETARAAAIIGGTSNLGGSLPDDLGEMTPAVESIDVVDVGRCGLAVQSVEVTSLVVVEELGDDGGHVVGGAAGSDVLAVSAAIGGAVQKLARAQWQRSHGFNVHVVGIVARLGNLQGGRGNGVVPLESWGRVVGAVSIVMVDDALGVAIGAGVATAGSSSGCGSWCLIGWGWLVGNWRWGIGSRLWSWGHVDNGGGWSSVGWLALALPLPPLDSGCGGGRGLGGGRGVLPHGGVDIGHLGDGDGALLERGGVGQCRKGNDDN